jgi:Kef-type K+ transport system membrane component KefB
MWRIVGAPDLVVTLFAALATAAMGALVAVRLGQSAMLGYIVGGVIIGP